VLALPCDDERQLDEGVEHACKEEASENNLCTN
jgi:hypothetical protein